MFLLRKVSNFRPPKSFRCVSILSPEEKPKNDGPLSSFLKISGVTASIGGIIGLYIGIKDVISYTPSPRRQYSKDITFPDTIENFPSTPPKESLFEDLGWISASSGKFPTTPPGIGHVFSNMMWGTFYGGLTPTAVLLLPTVLSVMVCLLAAESSAANPWLYYWMLWDDKKKW